MPKLKLRTSRGKVIVTYNEKEILLPRLSDAWQYVFYHKFIASVNGEKIGYHNDTLYPVNSLQPPVVKKVAYFYDLGTETI